MNQHSLLDQFSKELVATGGKIHILENRKELTRTILEIIRSSSARTVAMTSEQVLRVADGLESQLTEHGIEPLVTLDPKNTLSDIEKSQVGITLADFAIAESGTIAVISRDERERLVTALPFTHIVVLDPKCILPDLEAAIEKMKDYLKDPSNLNSSSVISFITGPSRTADIELTLVRGVHGPNELHVVTLPEAN